MDQLLHLHSFPTRRSSDLNHRLPSFSLVIPDLDDDAHDQPISFADQWLEKNFVNLIDDPVFRRDVLLIVTFDENDAKFPYLHRHDNRIYTVFWGDSVIPGQVDEIYSHYDLLRTIEAIFSVAPMAKGDRDATVIGGIWR